MKMKYFGDSYDFVKKFLLSSIAPDAKWAAFPMFTEEVTRDNISAYESFLGVEVVCPDTPTVHTDHAKHLSALPNHRHIFLDPDTGIKLETPKSTRSVHHVYIDELVKLCKEQQDRLLLVFDQSVKRACKCVERKEVAEKLRVFRESDVHGFAYHSGHVFFHVLLGSESARDVARSRLRESGIPEGRFVDAT